MKDPLPPHRSQARGGALQGAGARCADYPARVGERGTTQQRIRWRRGTVTALGRAWRDAQELTAEVDGDGEVRALAHPSLVGVPEVGDTVLLNTTAWAQRLGTGGYALVVAVPDRLPPDPSGPGHLVKARYTPLQVSVQGVDEQDTEHHRTIADAEDLAGMPVVVADLHSALPAALIGVLATDPDLRVAYVMTDGGALVAGFSRTLSSLAPSLAGVVTVGQAFGGDLEAVTLHTGLLAAKYVLGADVAIVSQGPGNLGTGTPWGFSGVAAGEACNAVTVLGGEPVGALRGLGSELGGQVEEALAGQPERNRVVWMDVDGLEEALGLSPVPLSTMGRGWPEERAYFLAAAAAGRYAALQVPLEE